MEQVRSAAFIYRENAAAGPIFQDWLNPFHDLGARTVTLNNTGGTDHQAFDAVGIPGFQFIQDPMDYNTRTHHSNQDTFDRLAEEDLKRAATIVAAFVYHTSERKEPIPEKNCQKLLKLQSNKAPYKTKKPPELPEASLFIPICLHQNIFIKIL
jgi:hypothetical protein